MPGEYKLSIGGRLAPGIWNGDVMPETDLGGDVRFYSNEIPWTEGYQRTLDEKNTVLFLTARLPQREQLFKWAGQIVSIKYVLLAKKDKNISITAP